MSRNNSNTENDNTSHIRKSNFKSYSRVCYSDPNQPGRMICKEDENINGNRNHKEIIYNTKSNTSDIINQVENQQQQVGFVPFLKSLFNRNSQHNDYSQSQSQDNSHSNQSHSHSHSNHNQYPEYNRIFEINQMNQIGNELLNHFFSDPFFNKDPIDSLMNNIEREFFIDLGNFSNNNHYINNNNKHNNKDFTNERKRPSTYNNIKVYDV